MWRWRWDLNPRRVGPRTLSRTAQRRPPPAASIPDLGGLTVASARERLRTQVNEIQTEPKTRYRRWCPLHWPRLAAGRAAGAACAGWRSGPKRRAADAAATDMIFLVLLAGRGGVAVSRAATLATASGRASTCRTAASATPAARSTSVSHPGPAASIHETAGAPDTGASPFPAPGRTCLPVMAATKVTHRAWSVAVGVGFEPTEGLPPHTLRGLRTAVHHRPRAYLTCAGGHERAQITRFCGRGLSGARRSAPAAGHGDDSLDSAGRDARWSPDPGRAEDRWHGRR